MNATIKLCECGCGAPAPLAKNTILAIGRRKGITPLQFLKGHNARTGVTVGYAQRTTAGKRRTVHAIVAEKALGKPLPRGAVVHHVDGVKTNNAPGNLVICPSHRYHMLLHRRADVLAAGGDPNRHLLCAGCGVPKVPDDFHRMGRTTVGRQSRCKQCQAASAARRNAAERQKAGA